MNKPDIHPEACLMPGAQVLGDVTLAAGSSVWCNAVLRGDYGPIWVGENSNVQDLCVLHCDQPGQVYIGRNVSVGHSCVLHGCTVADGALVGMGSVVLDNAEIGENAMVGAGSLVTHGTVIPAGMLAFGRPAKVVRPLTAQEKQDNLHRAQEYVDLKNRV